MPDIRPVILSGGSGTRLWPLSTPELPKQFAPLLPGASLFERALTRLSGADALLPIVVTGETQLGLVDEAAERTRMDIELTIVEPEGRNTAPAALAAALASNDDDVLAILPSDHLIRDTNGFARSVRNAAEVARKGRIVTLGIQPDGPETGYGYIEFGEEIGGARHVLRFKEKPERSEAERLVSDGKHLWNSGIFVVTGSVLVAEAEKHCPEVLDGVRASMVEPTDGIMKLAPLFSGVEKISIDHAIMEKTSVAAVMPLDVGWDDIGSFDALWAIAEKDADGNSITGQVASIDARNTLIRATARRVAVLGVEDLVVVETPEVVLVVPRSRSQQVRQLLEDEDRHR